MPSYVAFLRAVNVGKRQVKMADLRGWLEDDGFTDVETHIQTGNVKVATSMRSAAKVEQRLEHVIAESTGFEVPCIVFTPAQLRQVYDDAAAIEPPPFSPHEKERRYAVLYKQAPNASEVSRCAEYAADLESVVIIGRAAHVWIAGGMADARVFKELARIFEPGTNRSLTVLGALVEKWA